MPHALRFIPALAGVFLLLPMLSAADSPADRLCRMVAPQWLAQHCLARIPHPSVIVIAALALIALTLLLLMRWQRSRPRAASYDSDAGRWVVLGWVLAIGGTISLMAGLLLIGSNGWPFSHQSRHVAVKTGQLPLSISTVQRRYLARYSGVDERQSLCASFGDVTVENRSRTHSLALDLHLIVTPRDAACAVPRAAMPTRDDLAAIPRRGSGPHVIFANPVALAPRESLRRELIFVFRDPQTELSDRDYTFALAVNDRSSGQTVSFALPAEYRG